MIRYTKQALASLEDIFEEIYADKPGSAKEFMKKMRESIENLSTMPYLGKECKHKKIEGDCRVYIFKRNYLIVYQIMYDDILIRDIINTKQFKGISKNLKLTQNLK